MREEVGQSPDGAALNGVRAVPLPPGLTNLVVDLQVRPMSIRQESLGRREGGGGNARQPTEMDHFASRGPRRFIHIQSL